MRRKRGQAAMEFLMTYGWAILAAAVVIAALAAFGVFSPGKFVSARCTVTAPFECREHAASVATGITMTLYNGIQDESRTITAITISGCGSLTSQTIVVAPNDVQTVTVPCVPALDLNKKFKGDLSISFRIPNGAVDQTSSGTIIASVTA
ncbi:hypothetical protein HZA33_04125 [Candidatus Pacearchaeota archaeon]|nr:hypothetical protein [Candidatus Pacearchaeota archaeon]